MERRSFLTQLVLTGGALSLGVGCGREIQPGTQKIAADPESPVLGDKKMILEPARQIPVLAETDVLVIGGGPAGAAAAIAASRAGAETYLVERYNHLGGLWTGGLVLPLLSTHAIDRQKKARQVIFGIGGEMSQRLKDLGMSISEVNPVIDPEAGKYVLDEMIRESGVKMLYHTFGSQVIMEGNTLRGVFIESKSGRMAVLAKVVIDCTGDGDIFHWAGEPYDVMKYHIGLVHRLGNIDRIDTGKTGYVKMDVGSPTPLPGVNWVNMHGQDDQDGVDMLNLSRLQMEYRREIWENVQKIRKTPGHEQVFLLDTASQLGVRMSRMVEAEYKLTLEDTMTYRSFDDVIGISGAWTSMLYKGKRVSSQERPLWQIPYRSLLPKKTENLLVAGRCFCFERELAEDTRIIGTCLITGHGAGAAAGLAVKEKQSVRDLDIAKLKQLLLQQKAWLG
ncbi:MAG: FAD-dependent oxidoreductase [Bacteroidales bacterium]|nr:FAD-dependent oxidoreductase [Bacteroidales bacterium]